MLQKKLIGNFHSLLERGSLGINSFSASSLFNISMLLNYLDAEGERMRNSVYSILRGHAARKARIACS